MQSLCVFGTRSIVESHYLCSMEKALIFDTLLYVKRLRDAGFTDRQAEVQAETIKELLEEQIATKRDLREMKSRIILKVGAMISASIAITSTLVKLL